MRLFLFLVAGFGLGACGEDDEPRARTDDEPGSRMDGGTQSEFDAGVANPMCTDGQFACNGVCLSGVGDAKGACSVFAAEREVGTMRAAGDDLLYSTKTGEVFVFEPASGNRRKLGEVTGQSVMALARDGDQVFLSAGDSFSSKGRYYRVAYAGGTPEAIPAKDDAGVPVQLMKQVEVVGDTLYGLPDSALDQSVFTLPKAGGALDETVAVSTDNFAIDHTALYTATGTFDEVIRRSPLEDIHGGAMTLAERENVELLAVDATHVYWARMEFNDLGWAIERMAKHGGGSAEMVATGNKSHLTSMVVSDGYVYFTARGNSLLKRVPVAGGAPETLATFGSGDIQSVVVVGKTVFVQVWSSAVLQVKL